MLLYVMILTTLRSLYEMRITFFKIIFVQLKKKNVCLKDEINNIFICSANCFTITIHKYSKMIEDLRKCKDSTIQATQHPIIFTKKMTIYY